MRTSSVLRLLALAALPLSAAATGVLPLQQNAWSDPGFVARFTGSYGFDTEKNPSITSEEKKLFEALAPVIPTDPARAVQMLQAALTPQSSGAVDYTLGNLHFQAGRTAEATAAYEAALQKFPGFIRARQNLGILLVQQGSLDAALAHLLQAAEAGGLNGPLMGLIGFCHLNGGRTASALDAYRLALVFEPASRDWRLGKAQCLVNTGQHKEAVAMLEEMIAATPADTNLLMLQANAFLADGQPMSAAGNLQTVHALGKGTANSLVLLGDILVNAGNPDLALPSYLEAVASGGLPAERLLRMVRILAARDAWSEADRLLAAVKRTPVEGRSPREAAELLNLEAQVALGLDDDARAAGILERVVASDPLNGRALLLLADYHAKQGDVDRAALDYDRAAAVAETEHEALVQHARMLVGRRSFARAAELLARAQVIRPQPNVAAFLAKVEAAALASAR